MSIRIRKMRMPDDNVAATAILNSFYSEPITPEQLQEEEDKIPPGVLQWNDNGELLGWDRPKWVAEDGNGRVIGYAIAWRAPWTEPGTLFQTIVVVPEARGRGAGEALLDTVLAWADEVKASRLVDFMRDSDERSLRFAEKRQFTMERHTFESVLELASFHRPDLDETIVRAEHNGIRFVTLADEPGEANERKLYEVYKTTTLDIPGYKDDFPWFEEWRKWSIGRPDIRPEWIHIAKDGEEYVGVATLQHFEQTNAMYHEFTGVLRAYRGQRLALALKLLAIQTAKKAGAAYLRTHNDSMNAPMLRINRDLLGFRAEPGLFKMVRNLK